MKYIVTTDTHLGRNNNDKSELEITEKFFEWIVEISIQYEINKFIHLGDYFDNRKSIAIPTLSKSLDIINMLTEVFDFSYLILGNHDCYYKNKPDPNSLEIFSPLDDFKNNHPIEVVTNPKKVENILFVPWISDTNEIEKIKNNDYDAEYVMGHLPINEITLNRYGRKSEREIFNISDFKEYKKVFSGHFHQKGSYSNIEYIGAPYHISFNDSGERGAYIFDSENESMEFIEYNGAPKYYILDGENYDENLIEGNNIRIDFFNNIGLNKIDEIVKKVESLNPNKLKISYKFSTEFTESSENDKIDEIKGNREILLSYISESKVPDHISIKTMESIISSLENE